MERSVDGTPRSGLSTPLTAGVVCAVVGFAATFAVVLGGLQAVGATPGQATSGLIMVTLMVGAASLLLSWHHRIPLVAAWSTPGAALLMSVHGLPGGWPGAVGAFLVCGLLLTLTGLWPLLASLVGRIPPHIAQAVLAGVLLPLCVAPFKELASSPLAILPVLAAWLLIGWWRPRWAVPGALAVAVAVVAISASGPAVNLSGSAFIPRLEFVAPVFDLQAIAGIALPLYFITMASQNIPGAAIMGSFGYQVPWRSAIVTTGAGSLIAAPFGGHAVNLAAISAALAAGPEAGPSNRRWIAGVSAGVTYLLLGLGAASLSVIMLAAPAGVLAALSGVALIGTLASAIAGAVADRAHWDSSSVTFIVAASGFSAWGFSSACWALAAGLLVQFLRRRHHRSPGPAPTEESVLTGSDK
ncbi:benzoate/H(+) symporter BenE family transporter [Arthrobacter woluwensis]|uniref:benzoate/H(+) symporter BenE family transporter n=1 Tax=Arthrobacter woluwensis TaxID=156980 RepID=UPI0015E65F88|nr:benzoate/H(+) symporter BenE family transporter [Arthrobacter woluwensis]